MIPSLLYTERYRNVGTRTYSRHAEYSEAGEKYRPDSTTSSFELPCWWLPREYVHIYQANPPDHLAGQYLRGESVRFAVHPQLLQAPDSYIKNLFRRGVAADPLLVAPSSSTRTLYSLLANKIDHGVKVHFPVRISRYGRKMRDEVIAQAVNVSRELEADVCAMGEKFAFLREVLGVSHVPLEEAGQTARGENWGYLVREMQPFPYSEEQRVLLPGFALYGGDFFDASLPPLLFSLIGDNDPLQYILEQILLPIVDQWIRCFQKFGYMMEPHGQNVLLEIDETMQIRRIVHRDLSVGIDMRLRRAKGVLSTGLNEYNRMESGEFCSVVYDMFMGNHFFERIVACCRKKFPQIAEEEFRKPCRHLFAASFPESLAYFPPTIHYFSEERDQYGKPFYADTGREPVWR